MNWVDILSLLAWGGGALAGLIYGLMRAWVPFVFLVAALGIAGGIGGVIGDGLFAFIESEASRETAGFFLVFAAMLGMGIIITVALRRPLSLLAHLVSLFPLGIVFNRAGGLVLGAVFGLILLSVLLIGLHQYPGSALSDAIAESSFSSGPIAWVDRYVTALEIVP